MNKKRWALVILAVLLVVGYFKLFYKTWDNTGVTKNADIIIALDIKGITNTLTWNFITTPSQWKNSDLFSSSAGDSVSWDDMIKLPDYVFIFHKAGQPENAFYTLVQVNDKEDFEKGLKQFHFEKTATGSYVSKEIGIEFIQNESKLLVGNAAVPDKQCIIQVADELFNKKQFITKDSLQYNVAYTQHLSATIHLFKNSALENDYIIQGSFDKSSITFATGIAPDKPVHFTAGTFHYNDSSLVSLGFIQPWPDAKQLLPDSTWKAISKAVNFDIDSFLLQTNHSYQLDVAGIYSRIDSAVSYSYDDNFNPVEKIVVNKVEEPAFNLSIHGDSVQHIFNYWKNSGKLETNGDSNLFTPVPFVRSYCKIVNPGELTITSDNYRTAQAKQPVECVFFLKLSLAKLPDSLQKYIPAGMAKWLKNIEAAEINIHYASKKTPGTPSASAGQPGLYIILYKKKNDLPLIEWQ